MLYAHRVRQSTSSYARTLEQGRKLDQIFDSELRATGPDRQVWVNRSKAGEACRNQRSMSLWVKIEDETPPPLRLLHDNIDLSPAQRMKGMGDPNRTGHFGCTVCSR